MSQLIDDYLAGPQKLRDALAGMTEDQLDAKPVPGKWSTRQVVCHITDCEIVYADRMKRVMVEDNPAMLNLDPDTFAAGLAYDQRDVEEELQLIEATRRHLGRILGTLEPGQFNALANTRPMVRCPWKHCLLGSPTTSRITSHSSKRNGWRWRGSDVANKWEEN